jgi:hypothetical protein
MGVTNSAVDTLLSRHSVSKFFSLFPKAPRSPTHLISHSANVIQWSSPVDLSSQDGAVIQLFTALFFTLLFYLGLFFLAENLRGVLDGQDQCDISTLVSRVRSKGERTVIKDCQNVSKVKK